MRISDWSSDVCSSDLPVSEALPSRLQSPAPNGGGRKTRKRWRRPIAMSNVTACPSQVSASSDGQVRRLSLAGRKRIRSEEHTSELQSLMRISYAVFCVKKKRKEEQKPYMDAGDGDYDIYDIADAGLGDTVRGDEI